MHHVSGGQLALAVVFGVFIFFFFGVQKQLVVEAPMTSVIAVTGDGERRSGKAVLHNLLLLPSWDSMPSCTQLVYS